MRTSAHIARELKVYLKANGIEAYTGTRKKALKANPTTNLFNPYVIISHTPGVLRQSDMVLAGNEKATRTAYITVHCVGNYRDDDVDDGADLLEVVNDLIEYNWQPSDGAKLLPMSSYALDTPYINTQTPRVIHSQRYKSMFNLH